MPRTTHQTKLEKAKYDKERKASERRERRFTKPLKLFFQRKYPTHYAEFVKFFSHLEKEHPGKKDLTKTDKFKEFLSNHPVQEKSIVPLDAEIVINLFPNLVSTLESPTEATSERPNIEVLESSSSSQDQTPTSERPNIEVLESSSSSQDQTSNMHETPTSERPNTISELLDEMFGPDGINEEDLHGIDEDLHRMEENSDEGIELDHFNELAFDIEPFDFELETEGF